ncbi:hypothetical protein P9112_010574 [Eukaryota sp. TZLM1-RC]
MCNDSLDIVFACLSHISDKPTVAIAPREAFVRVVVPSDSSSLPKTRSLDTHALKKGLALERKGILAAEKLLKQQIVTVQQDIERLGKIKQECPFMELTPTNPN